MVTIEDAIIAKIEREGKHFEIFVDPDLAYDLKEGKTVSISRMLGSPFCFTDARKAEKASPSDIEKVFHTHVVEEIAEKIVKEGELQLTTDFRRRKIEEKRKQIASFIARNAINPQTRVPHPPERILTAMETARVNIDPFKPAEQQVDDIIDAIKSILPISIEELVLSIEIPAKYSGRAYGLLKELGTIQKDNWLSDGSLYVKLLIPAGLKENVFRRLGSITEGNVKITEEAKK